MKHKFIGIAMLLLLSLPSSGVAQGDRMTAYGFFDLEFEGSNSDPNNFTTTFDQHHFNMISIFQLADQWRVFGDIAWEHGPKLEAGGGTARGTGEIVLARAWVEYAHTDGFKVMAGKFLPPFGYYNLFHDATPTFLSTFLPNSIYGKHSSTAGGSQRLYSKFGTGLQVLGSPSLGESQWRLDYHAYLINGRGPNENKVDNNQNKGIGARLMLATPGDDIRFGLSYYQDNNGTRAETTQRTFQADVAFGRSGFFVEAEGIIPSLEELDPITDLPNDQFRTGLGYYVQGSYSMESGLTPFVRYDFFDPDTDVDNDGDSNILVGLNYAVTSFVFLKGQVQFVSFQDPGTDSFEQFIASISVAF